MDGMNTELKLNIRNQRLGRLSIRDGANTQYMQYLNTILNGDAVGTKMSVRHRQGGCSSEVAVKRGSTVQTKKHYIKSLLLDKRSCFSQSKTSTVQLTIEHMFVF